MSIYDHEWQNRDSETHMELTKDDLMSPREITEWEMDLIEAEINKEEILNNNHDEVPNQ